MIKMRISPLPTKTQRKGQVLKLIEILKSEEFTLIIVLNKKRTKMMPFMKEFSFTNQELNFLIFIISLTKVYVFSFMQIKIIIASEYIRKENPEVLKRNIFGTDPYTSNSDAVCMLVHSGMININTFQNKKYEGVEMTCKVIKPKKNYTGITKNNLTSRSLKGFNGNALKPESVKNLTSLGPI